MQVTYSGKTKDSQSRDFKFPCRFCVTQNPKHWLNEIETLKLIDELILGHSKKISCFTGNLLRNTHTLLATFVPICNGTRDLELTG